MNFNRIKKNYDNHLWTKDMVKTAVKKGVITEIQYAMITGEIYNVDSTLLNVAKQ